MSNTFFDSVFKFSDPVRYFKANDPYYYEVDNIPLKQLQENCNFLKDQISKLITSGIGGLPSDPTAGSLGRDSISELQPYVDGTDNKVRVRPGRYTARINDAYTIQPLQFIKQIAGFIEDNPPRFNTYEYATRLNQTYNDVIGKLKSSILAQNSLGMNGLAERCFIFAVRDLDRKNLYMPSGIPPGYNNPGGYAGTNGDPVAYPNVIGNAFNYLETVTDTNGIQSISALTISLYNNLFNVFGGEGGYYQLTKLESLFIKRWRGIARTAIVNVEEELEIDIPPFSDDDFYYIDSSGTRVPLTANQRIDLVFIYSKPVDTSAVTISKYSPNPVTPASPGEPTKINKPILGIVKGAGVGVNYTQENFYNTTGNKSAVSLRSLQDGTAIMLANPSDEQGPNMGFGTIKGSFPSPDDLMNIAPLLSEDLEQNNLALIGQSILPVAYVVVRKNANLNENSNNIIEVADLIDIRPFFRTTELSYNERAGLAAATPQVSIANPVATEGYVDYIHRQLDYKISQVTVTNNQQSNVISSIPRIVGAGYIKGGTNYGVEGTLLDFLRKEGLPNSTTIDLVNTFDYPSNTGFNANPDWDLASWAFDSDLSGGSPGSTKFDWINYSISKSFDAGGQIPPGVISDNSFSYDDNSVAYGPLANSMRAFNVSNGRPLGISNYPVTNPSANGGYYTLFYVSKTIKINRSLIPWASDYVVNARLHNCVPMSSRVQFPENTNGRYGPGATISNIWISKKKNSSSDFEFTIFVGWSADEYTRQEGSTILMPKVARWKNAIGPNFTRMLNYNGFAVITKDMLTKKDLRDIYPYHNGRTNVTSTNYNVGYYSSGGNKIGVAQYPTVSFEVIGIPSSYNLGQNLGGTNPYLQLIT